MGHLKGENDGSDFKAGVFIKNLLVWGPSGTWDDFLGLGHCLVKRDIE
jgi:hypothetical protein